MENAIQKAIEGGYTKNSKYTYYNKDGTLGGWWYKWKSENEDGEEIELENPCCYDSYQYQTILFLDPLFWQCLGKQQGWKRSREVWCHGIVTIEQIKSRWENEMHSFTHHIAEGKDVDSFFNQLLK